MPAVSVHDPLPVTNMLLAVVANVNACSPHSALQNYPSIYLLHLLFQWIFVVGEEPLMSRFYIMECGGVRIIYVKTQISSRSRRKIFNETRNS